MPRFSVKWLSKLLSTDPSRRLQVVEESEQPPNRWPAIRFEAIYKRVLRPSTRRRRSPSQALEALWSKEGCKPLRRIWLQSLTPHVEWYQAEVLPRIARLISDMDAERRTANPSFRIAGQPVTGGAHWRVLWHDGTERLVYVVGPKSYTRRRMHALRVLLQIYAVQVAGLHPTMVVLIDLHGHRIIELEPSDPDAEAEVVKIVQWLVQRQRKRGA